MAPGCFQTLQNTGGSGFVNKIYLIIYTGRYIIVTLVRFKCALLLRHTSPTFLCKGPNLLLWAGSWAACGQTAVSVTLNCLNYCITFIVHNNLQMLLQDTQYKLAGCETHVLHCHHCRTNYSL